jgi:hypothetical protein
MKNLTLFLLVFVVFHLQSGLKESFDDGNFTKTPSWFGSTDMFKVNSDFQLQSCSQSTGTYTLFTNSDAIYKASWECNVRIDYATSSSNYVNLYIISDVSSVESGLNGYFVQIGNTNDEVSLYFQEGFKKTRIIDGVDKRTDGKTVDISIKVTRDVKGRFVLYSKLKFELDYFMEGEAIHHAIQQSGFFGLSYTCTSTTGSFYYFDDVRIEGAETPDTIPPLWKSLSVVEGEGLQFVFSEPVKFQSFQLRYEDQFQPLKDVFIHPGDTAITVFPKRFPKQWKSHEILISGITDFSGIKLTDSTKFLVLSDIPLVDEIYFNEIMFNPNDSSSEYVELFNPTEKLLDLSDLIIATMKSDGSYQTGKLFPPGTLIEPFSYLVLTQDSARIQDFHQCADTVKIIKMSMYPLSNESGTIALFDKTRSIVYDDFYWEDQMHHVLLHNTKGISLEKAIANIPSRNRSNWYSCSTNGSGGTPGYCNSQHIKVINNPDDGLTVEDDFFTPDNDGDRDVFLVKLRLDEPGYLLSSTIMSISGEKVKNIMVNQLAAIENYIYWDGTNNALRMVSPGLYLMFVQYFHPETGKRKSSSIPIAVAFR